MPSDLDGVNPLSADEPLDLDAVRRDDALLDAIGHDETPAGADAADPLIPMLAAWAASARLPERVHVVLTPPEAWPPRVHPTYHAWRDAPLPTEPTVDTFVLRVSCMVAFLVCALVVGIGAVLP
jgi:hypothetical protein